MTIRAWVAALSLAVAVASTTAGRVEAQVVRGTTGVRTYGGAGSPIAVSPGTTVYGTVYGQPAGYAGGISGYTPPYSYYAAIPPAPARVYVDYAESGFNFYGRPYGHPNDRWSWDSLSAGGSLLDRYYYPPVR